MAFLWVRDSCHWNYIRAWKSDKLSSYSVTSAKLSNYLELSSLFFKHVTGDNKNGYFIKLSNEKPFLTSLRNSLLHDDSHNLLDLPIYTIVWPSDFSCFKCSFSFCKTFHVTDFLTFCVMIYIVLKLLQLLIQTAWDDTVKAFQMPLPKKPSVTLSVGRIVNVCLLIVCWFLFPDE
jgi:hypothetical protein